MARGTAWLVGAIGIGAAVGAGAVAAPTPAHATAIAVQDDELSSGPLEEIPPRLKLLDRTGTKVTRVDVLWRTVASRRPKKPADPFDPAYDWGRTDAIFSGLAERRILPIVTVYSAPAWATRGRDAPAGSEVNPNAPSAADFAAFMAAIAKRYSGTVRRKADNDLLPLVRHWEIWNEPNLGAFFGPQVSAGRRIGLTRYTSMLRRSYRAIKKVSPRSTVIAGVGGPRSSTGVTGTGALPWLRGIAASGAPFDAYSQHVYPAVGPLRQTPAFPAWATLGRAIRELDRFRRHRGKPLYITEAGYTTRSTPFRSVRVSEPQQASHLRTIVRLPIVRSSRVPVVMWFNLQDNVAWPGGLRRLNGSAKPSLRAFKSATRANRVPRTLLAGVGPGANVLLTRGQLETNQKVFQAAVRRVNALERALGRLSGSDIRPGGLRRVAFDSSVTLDGSPTGQGTEMKRTLEIGSSSGGGGRIRLTKRQLLINQRIAQAAVRRANGIAARLDEGLTGGDLRNGSITAGRIAKGLSVSGTSTADSPAGPTTTKIGKRNASRPGAISLTPNQLLVNQRVGQAAVRRANDLIEKYEKGLTSADFQRGSISARDLSPGLRS